MSVLASTVPAMDEALRGHLDFALRVQVLRAVYHRALGEAIQLRLAFRDAPEIDVTEDLDTDSVTLRLGEGTLTLHPGQEHAEDRETIREWIRERVDVTRLTRGSHHGPGVRYWRSKRR